MPSAADRDIAALFGEHALCLAAAAATDGAPGSDKRTPAQPIDPAGHDGLGCCAWQGSAGCVLPGGPRLTPSKIASYRPEDPAAATVPPPRSIGAAQARAPPAAA